MNVVNELLQNEKTEENVVSTETAIVEETGTENPKEVICRVFQTNMGQKLVTIPKNSSLMKGDIVKILLVEKSNDGDIPRRIRKRKVTDLPSTEDVVTSVGTMTVNELIGKSE